jgi:hypothetical protein
MDRDGSWLDVGCANGFLLATLPTWLAGCIPISPTASGRVQ